MKTVISLDVTPPPQTDIKLLTFRRHISIFRIKITELEHGNINVPQLSP